MNVKVMKKIKMLCMIKNYLYSILCIKLNFYTYLNSEIKFNKMLNVSVNTFAITPIIPSVYNRLNFDILFDSYKQEKDIDRSKTNASLFRLQTIPTFLFHEQLGIVSHFRDRRPKTRNLIDNWIDNTSDLSEVNIMQDLEVLKNFLLNCDDIFTNDDDRDNVIEAMKLFLKERCLWCCGSTRKLESLLDIY